MEKTENKMQAKVAAFPFYCPKPLLFACILCPVNKPFTIVAEVNEALAFPIYSKAF